MLKNTRFLILTLFLITIPNCLAQVDIVYNDLVWSDDFTTNGPVSATNWFHQTQLPNGTGWFNGEVQHYTNLQSNSFVDAGLLHIVAKKENYTSQGVTKAYTSARLNSKFAFKYGRIDVRAKLPVDSGTWPAIWMLGKNVNEPGGYFSSAFGTTDWPACGEIDIMEHGIFPSQTVDYVQSTLHTPSSFANSVNHGGTMAANLATEYHVYSLNWSPYQLSFLLDGVVYYTYNPAVKNDSTWPFDKEQYLLLNIALGGIAGNLNANFDEASMLIDYVKVYQNTASDTQAPTNFTASIGTVTSSSVEILVNVTDNSGSVGYEVAYGASSVSSAGASGVQKSIVVSGLSPNTTYNFLVSANDQAGNQAANNAIPLAATTLALTQCSGTSSAAQQGSFTVGYTYSFQTIGSNVQVTIDLLDTDKVGLVAFLWNQNPFGEVQMTNVSGNTFTVTIPGLTAGTTINKAVKFAFAGGLSVTPYFSYVVGNDCSLGEDVVTSSAPVLFPNPVDDMLNLRLPDEQNTVFVTDIAGRLQVKAQVKAFDTLDLSALKSGIYFIRIENSNGSRTSKIVKR
ncbi:MAG: glycosyl hydrolase family protein [Flavobacterium sp.]|uniref:family 16 glycosylhydrolase n=1 Tax=Flavobacterium sp. TaxID=239 RepID=UPI0011FDBB80|nr:family 16 glycosylhydrolase [Flavobacterium sp.]RZJ66284.1 MAG: glycosyl hydrolase family protein [Flavobacterium sp.]